ncbi:glycosyltransferase family 4 protein [Candidatus Parcubacteria bacterium]|nr:glycosyltransferase family 4 protein [Candidatus Parcubacteria bacterium]
MKVCIAGNVLFGSLKSGVYQYTKRLTEALLQIDQSNQYTIFGFLFFGKKIPSPPLGTRPNLSYRFIRFLPGRVYSRLHKKRLAPPVDLLLRSRPDIFFFPHFVRYPLALKEKSIIVIYDLSFIFQAKHSDQKNQWYLSRFVPRSIKKADHIVTISQNSQQELVEHYAVSPKRITIINPAVDHGIYNPRSRDEIGAIKNKFGLSDKYVLYTGTLEPRKNIVGLLNAYAALPKLLQEGYALVLAGGKGWMDREILRRLKELEDLNIFLTGYVPDEDLPALYSGASVFVYPSFYEGFGMPPLEAMACGVPVITSDNSSLPEVVGDAGIMIKAEDTKAITAAMERVLTHPKLAVGMRRKGLEQAKKFTWEGSARKLLKVLEKVHQT